MRKIGQLIPHWKKDWLKNWCEIFRQSRNYFRQSLTALCMWTSINAHAWFLNVNLSEIDQLMPHWKHDWLIQVTQWTQYLSALRSGITVASEVHPRRGYCWLKTFPNTPQDGLKYSRLCNFWRSIRGPNYKLKQWKHLIQMLLWFHPDLIANHCGDKTLSLSSPPSGNSNKHKSLNPSNAHSWNWILNCSTSQSGF